MNYSSLTPEQRAALDSLKKSHAKMTGSETTLSDAEYESMVMTGIINGEAKRLFDAAVERLANAARSMPYVDRIALIQHIESQTP